MAKVKKKTSSAKNTSKPAKKSAGSPKKSPARAGKSAAKPLSQEERQRLLKPVDGYTELAERFAAAWTENRSLKVPGISPSKIRSSIERARKAAAREDALKRKLEEKLRPLQDSRLQAEHDVWKLMLDAYAVAKAQARFAPEIGRAFTFLGDALSKRARGKKAAPAAAPATEPTSE